MCREALDDHTRPEHQHLRAFIVKRKGFPPVHTHFQHADHTHAVAFATSIHNGHGVSNVDEEQRVVIGMSRGVSLLFCRHQGGGAARKDR